MAIPIANVYRMLLYAWEHLGTAPTVSVTGESAERLENLLGDALTSATETLIRRGLGRGYQSQVEQIAGLRGKLQLSETIKTMSFLKGETVCEVSELTTDTRANRAIKGTLSSLVQLDGLEPKIRSRARACIGRFAEVSDQRVTASDIARVQMHSNNAYYRLVLNICALLQHCMVPAPGGGRHFRDFRDDDEKMYQIFETFLRRFLALEQGRFKVGQDTLPWGIRDAWGDARALMPGMHTDVTLRSDDEVVVIDAKFYGKALAGYYKLGFRSPHLYQLYSYLHATRRRYGDDMRIRGALVYPAAEHTVDAGFEIDGFRVRIVTIDLAAPWADIEQAVLSLAA
jgi:5-methylcytosine-specific restriction enzyme subunit McrC